MLGSKIRFEIPEKMLRKQAAAEEGVGKPCEDSEKE